MQQTSAVYITAKRGVGGAHCARIWPRKISLTPTFGHYSWSKSSGSYRAALQYGISLSTDEQIGGKSQNSSSQIKIDRFCEFNNFNLVQNLIFAESVNACSNTRWSMSLFNRLSQSNTTELFEASRRSCRSRTRSSRYRIRSRAKQGKMIIIEPWITNLIVVITNYATSGCRVGQLAHCMHTM